MLFWLFVIIIVGAFIGLLCLLGGKRKIAILEARKEQAYMVWLTSNPNNCSKEEYTKITKEYHTARDACLEARKKYRKTETARDWCWGFIIGAGIVLFIMSMALTIIYPCAPAVRAQLEVDYEVLSWEVQNQVYHDGGDDVVGKKELYNQVREWNGELKKNQYYEKNFWVGIFVPNIYGDLKPIELK